MARKPLLIFVVILLSITLASCTNQPSSPVANTESAKVIQQPSKSEMQSIPIPQQLEAEKRPIPKIIEEKDLSSNDYITTVDFGLFYADTYNEKKQPVKSDKRVKLNYTCDYKAYGHAFAIGSMITDKASGGRVFIETSQELKIVNLQTKTILAPNGKLNITFIFLDNKIFEDSLKDTKQIIVSLFLSDKAHFVELKGEDIDYIKKAMAQSEKKK